MISIIAAVSENNVIGHKGGIPWRIPRDFKHFKDTTTGHPIVMGRKTFESIGRPLPDRENIILTKQDIHPQGYSVIHSIEPVLERAKNEEIFIIGGREIYNLFLPYTDKIYLTRVHATVAGDVMFPEKKYSKGQQTASEKFEKDEKNEFAMTFETYDRKK